MIIFMTGETAQGKTTLAKKIAPLIGAYLIHTDAVYGYIEEKTGFKGMEQMIHNQEKEDFYKACFHSKVSGNYKCVLVEGATLGCKREREYIKKAMVAKKVYFMKLESPYWEKRSLKKHKVKPQLNYIEWFDCIYEPPEKVYIIKDEEYLLNCFKKDALKAFDYL
jgi:shikimate kinase